MRLIRRVSFYLLTGAIVAGASAIAAQAAPVGDAFAQTPLFERMTKVNSGLHSYKARVHLDAAMSSFPYLHPTLEGTAYYKQPDRNAINFDSVPAMASLFKNVFPRLPAPAKWPSLYTMHQLNDSNGVTTVRLTPIKEGRVETLEVGVSDETAVPTGYTFLYRDGGSVHFDQRVSSHDGFFFVDGLDGKIDLPSIKADAKASFTGYQPNAAVTDAQVDGSQSK
jgi:hypothetical protein